MTRIVCISDTHTYHRQVEVPDGDILIHAGDITFCGEKSVVTDFNKWLGTLPHKYKVVIAGNHDWCFYQKSIEESRDLLSNAIYLQDSSYSINNLNIYGSPWQPEFYDWAFNLPRGEPLKNIWSKIPDNTDILVTHGPAWGRLDTVIHRGYSSVGLGCEQLAERITQLPHLKLHVFGHIHDSFGVYPPIGKGEGLISINASTCTESYKPTNYPMTIDL